MPNTIPPIQNSSDIRSTIKKTEKNIVDVFPTGCLTKNAEGKEITEIYDMIKSGAVAFTDDKKSIENAIVMNIAMEYSKQFNTVIMSTCYDTNLCREGQINEGKFSTLLGMKGIPEIAEYIKIAPLGALLLVMFAHLGGTFLAAVSSTFISKEKNICFIIRVSIYTNYFQ